MALNDAYMSLAELKAQGQVADTDNDTEITAVTLAVSRAIERFCGRQFNDAGSATARVYHPATSDCVRVDDFSTVTGLVVASDTAGDGTYSSTLTAANYSAAPYNGVIDGQTGHPFREIVVHLGETFRTGSTRPSVQVTAQWGWAAVPTDVKQAALIQGAKIFGRKYSHNGVIGFGDFVVRVASRLDPDVEQMLSPYRIQALVA